MSENTTEVEETEVYTADESGVAYSSESTPSAEEVAARPATIAPAAATGRRKEACLLYTSPSPRD